MAWRLLCWALVSWSVQLALVIAALGGTSVAEADTAARGGGPPLYRAEVRAGYGVAVGGGAGRASVRGSPLVLAARVAFAVREQPVLAGYAGVLIETLDRTGAGGEAGVVFEPTPRVRLRAGAIAMVAPYGLWGGNLGGGRCFRDRRYCLDLDGAIFLGGSDLPSGGAAVQLVLALGVGFDG